MCVYSPIRRDVRAGSPVLILSRDRQAHDRLAVGRGDPPQRLLQLARAFGDLPLDDRVGDALDAVLARAQPCKDDEGRLR